jgi:hypothetical protein
MNLIAIQNKTCATSRYTENIRIQNMTNPENIAWSFTTTHSSNWHPLPSMSHMLDVSLFDMNPGSHHLMSRFFHLVNSLLLFFVFRQMTGHIWQSAFVALLHDGKTEKVIRHFKTALKIQPNYIGARQNLQMGERQY